MIYLIDEIDRIPAGVMRDAFSRMPLERQQRASRYKQDLDRTMCVMAYWLLLYGLRKEYGIADALDFSYGKNGKPYFAGIPSIHFNISHCKAGIVCAVSNNEVGVDIQDVRTYNSDVARRVCSDYELEQIAENDEPARLFCKFWTIKEGFIKLRGDSISKNLKAFDAHTLFSDASCSKVSRGEEDYFVTCFGEGTIEKISFND